MEKSPKAVRVPFFLPKGGFRGPRVGPEQGWGCTPGCGVQGVVQKKLPQQMLFSSPQRDICAETGHSFPE